MPDTPENTYEAGLTDAAIAARAGTARIAKLNNNENPLGMSPAALEAAAHALDTAHAYPPGRDEALCAALAAYHTTPSAPVTTERVVATAGSVELIDLLLRAVVGPEQLPLAFRPCFPALAYRARQNSMHLRQVDANPDFSLDLDALARAVEPTTALVYLANPDNPTGSHVTAEAIAQLGRSLHKDCVLVVDEAYTDYADDPAALSMIPALANLPNLVIARTLSKAHGLAGLRVGYGLFAPALDGLAQRIRSLQLSFTISASASAAAQAALADTAHHAASVDAVRRGRAALTAGLAALGCHPVPSQGGYVMFRPPDTPGAPDAAALAEALLDHGVAVRPLGYAGLPGHLRVSAGTGEDTAQCLAALKDVLPPPIKP